MVEKLFTGLFSTAMLAAVTFGIGKWYKEWYFNQFKINYVHFDFGPFYFMFGSWATILVGFSLLSIVFSSIIPFTIPKMYAWKIISAMFLFLSVYIIYFWPFQFTPTGSFFKKIIGSRDLCIITLGFISTITSLVISILKADEFMLFKQGYLKIAELNPFFKAIIIISISIILYGYLMITGYFIGVYHARAAIWEGKMGVNWVKANERWWILTGKTDKDDYFLYDRENDKSTIAKREQITDFDGGFVTKKPKNEPSVSSRALAA